MVLFRPSRPDFIETSAHMSEKPLWSILFRPSRPDFIETFPFRVACEQYDRLFRPSRPDFIETSLEGAESAKRTVIVPAF